jgi:hypothetical protein
MSDNQTLVFIAVFLLLSLFWLFALIPFSAAVIFPEQRPDANGRSLDEMRASLLGLNEADEPFRVVADEKPTDLHLEWDVVDASWLELYATVKLTTTYRARMYLHEAKRELRYHEVIKSSSFWLGFQGMKPRFNFEFFYSAGIGDVIWSGLAYGIKRGWPPQIGEVYRFHLDTIWAKRQVERVARASGWAFRPVVWWFEASDRGVRLGRALSPPFMRDWPRLRYWSVLYGLSLVLLLIAPALLMPDITLEKILLGMGIVAAIALVHGAILGVWLWLRSAHERHVSRIEEREAATEE